MQLQEWYRSVPVITRAYMTACVLTTIAVHLDLVSTFDLYLNYHAIFKHYEVWRLVTNFLFFDHFGLNFVFHMYFLIRHSQALEESSFRGRTADYFFMWIFGAALLLILNFVFSYTTFLPKIMFLAPSLAFMAVYVWGRRNPNMRMSFLGLFTFTAPYLPWVILGFGLMLGQSPVFDLLGIMIGHIYFYLEDVLPPLIGRRVLITPTVVRMLFPQDNA